MSDDKLSAAPRAAVGATPVASTVGPSLFSNPLTTAASEIQDAGAASTPMEPTDPAISATRKVDIAPSEGNVTAPAMQDAGAPSTQMASMESDAVTTSVTSSSFGAARAAGTENAGSSDKAAPASNDARKNPTERIKVADMPPEQLRAEAEKLEQKAARKVVEANRLRALADKKELEQIKAKLARMQGEVQ